MGKRFRTEDGDGRRDFGAKVSMRFIGFAIIFSANHGEGFLATAEEENSQISGKIFSAVRFGAFVFLA